ncbi:hypothetical protein GCM10027589_01590 [Actinocorallia lasiicapitis]
MPRIATVVLTTGSLILGMGVFAPAVQARVPSAPIEKPVERAAKKPSNKAKGGFTTANGKSKLFKEIKVTGSYSVGLDKITVKYKVTDYKKDGWTPGVQFATIEAWDVDDSGVYFVNRKKKVKKNGRGIPPGSGSAGSIAGPPIASDVNHDQGTTKKCYTCKTKRNPRKKVYTNPLLDGKYTYKFSKAFTSKYTEGLFVREVLVKKKRKGKGYEIKKGPLTFVYSAPVGPVVGAGNDARAQAVKVPVTKAERAAIVRQLRKEPPTKFYPYSSATFADQPAGVTDWGIVGGVRQGDYIAPTTLVRVRDDRKDRRVAAARIFYVQNPDDPENTPIDGWVFYLKKDNSGRWGSWVSTSKINNHMFFQSCVGTVSGGKFTGTLCGKLLIGY